MKAARAASAAPAEFILSVVSGPDKGAAYQLLPPMTTIGRGPTNDVELTDPKCSRSHATVEFSGSDAIMRAAHDRAVIVVNGVQMREAPLRDGDSIRLGDTDFKFSERSPKPRPSLSIAAPNTAPSATPPTPRPGPALSPTHWGAPASAPYRAGPAPELRQRVDETKRGGGRLLFYGAIVAIALLMGWVLTSSPKQKATQTTVRSSADADAEIAALGERASNARKKKNMSPDERSRFLEADGHFRTGFRDFQKTQYDRALKSFETALAIDPKHEMATHYQKRASRMREQTLTDWMKEGRAYREKSMYSRCAAALDKVIKAIPNAQDVRRRESEALRDECDALNEAN